MKIIRTAFFLSVLLLGLSCQDKATPSNAVAATDDFPIPQDKLILDLTGIKGSKLVLTISENPDTFNSNLTTAASTSEMLNGNVYEGLTGLDTKTMKAIPALAKSWDISPDGLTYTYTMREGVRWSDGQPLTADDVLFTFQALLDPKTPYPGAESLQEKDGSFPEIKKVSENQVQFKLKNINVLFNDVVGSTQIIPKHIWKESYESGNFANAMTINDDIKKMVSSGPFMIDSFTPDQRVVLKRNPYYYAFDKNGLRLPYYDKVFYLIVPDLQSRMIKFQNGECDALELKPIDVDLLKRNESAGQYKVYDAGPSYNTTYLMFNQNTGSNAKGKPYVAAKKLKLFSDKRFKQAVSYAMDRNSFVSTAFQGRGIPIYNYTTPANKIWFNPKTKTYPFDLSKAKALLQEIGLKDSNNDGILEYEDGSPLEFTIMTNASNESRVRIGNLITNDLKSIGINARLNPMPFNTIGDALDNNFDFDAILLGWGTAVPPDPAMSKSVLLSSGLSHYWNPKQKSPATDWEKRIDELMYQNSSALDMETRLKTWHEVLDIWAEELPQIMIVTENVYVAAKDSIGNFKAQALRPYFNSLSELYDKNLNP